MRKANHFRRDEDEGRPRQRPSRHQEQEQYNQTVNLPFLTHSMDIYFQKRQGEIRNSSASRQLRSVIKITPICPVKLGRFSQARDWFSEAGLLGSEAFS
jgi:hypothetical protein